MRLLAGRRAGPVPPSLDADALLRLAERHRVAPLLNAAAGALEPPLPTDVTRRLRRHGRENAVNLLRQREALRRTMSVLVERDIGFVVLKGLTLAPLYGSAAERHVNDIDLLLHRSDDVWRAVDALLASGFESDMPVSRLGTWQRARLLRRRKDLTMTHPSLEQTLELHWRPFLRTDEWSGKALASEWPSGDVDVEGLVVPRVADPIDTLYLIGHGTLSAWFRLKWVVDVLRRLESMSDGELSAVRDAAIERGAERHYRLSAALLHELFGLELPSLSPAGPRERRRDTALLRRVLVALDEPTPGELHHRHLHSRLRGRVARIRYDAAFRPFAFWSTVRASLFAVELELWRHLPLPERLHPLYPLLAPLLSVRRLLPGRRSHWR